MKKLFIALFSAIVLLGVNTTANATTLNFDNVPENLYYYSTPIPQHDIFNWNPANYVGVVNKNHPTAIYYGMATESGEYAAVSLYSYPIQVTPIAANTTFTFNSVYLSTLYLSPTHDSDTVIINGYNSLNQLVHSDTATVFRSMMTFFDGKDHYKDISRLEFISDSYTNRTGAAHDNGNIIFDDFTYNAPIQDPTPTPEPSSMLLGLTSLIGMIRLRKKVS